MENEDGRALTGQALASEAPTGLHPTDFNPSRILWAENPLLTRVIVGDAERAILRIAIERDLREWDEYSEGNVDRWLGFAVGALDADAHCGDCTCVPMTCTKCMAEEWLGINTIKGCGKHGLYKIDGAFRRNGGAAVSIEEAIENLRNYDPKADWAGWEVHAPRWMAEAKRALGWLIAYRDAHFPRDSDASSSTGETP